MQLFKCIYLIIYQRKHIEEINEITKNNFILERKNNIKDENDIYEFEKSFNFEDENIRQNEDIDNKPDKKDVNNNNKLNTKIVDNENKLNTKDKLITCYSPTNDNIKNNSKLPKINNLISGKKKRKSKYKRKSIELPKINSIESSNVKYGNILNKELKRIKPDNIFDLSMEYKEHEENKNVKYGDIFNKEYEKTIKKYL